MKVELKNILKKPVKDSDPSYWGYVFRDQMEGFFDKFQREFEELVPLKPAQASIQNRVAMAKDHLRAIVEKMDKVGNLRSDVNFSDATSYLRWYAVTECHNKMAVTTKTLGDHYKVSWSIAEDVLDRLVQKVLKGATPEEVASFTSDSDLGSSIPTCTVLASRLLL